MIKNSFFKIVALGAVLIFASSCKKSSSVDPVDDTPSDRISNGLYVKKVGEAPSSNNILLSENVEGANTRVGFYASYLYLTAGSYQIANVIDQEVKQLYGGVSKDTTDARESKGGFDTYSLIPGYVLDGAPFVLTVDGFYKVVIDQASKEIVYVQIKRAELIGSATPGLWEGGSDGQ